MKGNRQKVQRERVNNYTGKQTQTNGGILGNKGKREKIDGGYSLLKRVATKNRIKIKSLFKVV